MKRLEGTFGQNPDEDRKKSRDAVLANLVLFASFVVVIRVAPIILNNM